MRGSRKFRTGASEVHVADIFVTRRERLIELVAAIRERSLECLVVRGEGVLECIIIGGALVVQHGVSVASGPDSQPTTDSRRVDSNPSVEKPALDAATGRRYAPRMSDMRRITLVDGPLRGYIYETDEDLGELMPLRFNGKKPYTQHVYHHGGSTPSGGLIYHHAGDDEGMMPLPHAGIDVPAHAFEVPRPQGSPKDRWAQQLADAEMDSWGEGQRRDFLEDR